MICGPGTEGGGEYRKRKVYVVGSAKPLPTPDKVPPLMKQLDNRLGREQLAFDEKGAVDRGAVIRMAVETYHRISHVHPFADGNGRVARIAMNHLLRRYDQGYVIFPPMSEPSPLWNALEEANGGDMQPLFAFASECMHVV